MPFNSILSWVLKKRLHQIDLFIKYPLDVQNELFRTLLLQAKDTEWGKKYCFSQINSFRDFVSSVPINEYDDIKADVTRMINGEKNILWPTDIKWFAKSSGTTNDVSKFIPVSKESLEGCHYKGGKDLLAIYYGNHPKSKLYYGKTLIVGGSKQINYLRENSYSGDLSAIIIENLPFWVELKRTPGKDIALLDDWEEKIEKMATSTMNEDVTNISGVPSWTLVLLHRILEKKGVSSISEVWPNLELYMHGGVNFGPYRQSFKAIFPKDVSYVETYNASEGFFGIKNDPDKTDMLLMLDYGIYYEFLPAENYGKEGAETIPLEDVEINKNYAPIISTNGGLWRYLLGDTIKFTSVFPFRIKITGRLKHFINTFGEELIIDNAEKAINEACSRTNSIITEFTAGPVFMEGNKRGAHEWLIEFSKAPLNIEEFGMLLDNNLKELNSDYAAKRTGDLSLGKPIIKQLENKTFYNWLKNKNKLGGQNKVPRLSNNRKYIDEIYNFINTQNNL